MSSDQLWLDACWFCGKNKAEGGAAVDVHMYKVLADKAGRDEDSLMAMMSVRWENLTVPVPRCTHCESVHKRRKHYPQLGHKSGSIIGIAAAVATYLGLATVWDVPLKVALEAAPIGGLIGWLIGRAIMRQEVRDQKDATEFPSVQRKVEGGWKMGDRP